MSSIDTDLLKAIKQADKQADKLTEKAREAIAAAMEARRTTGALIEKLKQFRGQLIMGMLADIMPAEKVKRMLSLNYYDRQGKDFLSDKVQLQKAGILTQQAPKNTAARRKGTNVIGATSKGVNSIERALRRLGGIGRLPQWQRDEIQAKLQPLAKTYVELAQGKR
jgi:hypothetical protein